jgi:hypothetical protein
MIVVKLMGGLGNQLFQYAFGRSLAEKNRTVLKFDLGFFKDAPGASDITPRQYELGVYQVAQHFAGPAEISAFFAADGKPWFRKMVSFPGGKHLVVRQEANYHFEDRFLGARGNIYLDGYWQSVKYFQSIESTIRKELVLRAEAVASDSPIRVGGGSQAVSLHVRRGDYVHNPHVGKVHPVCSQAYYQEAVALMAAKVANPHFFVFSDDIEWCRTQLRVDCPVTFVTPSNPGKNYLDMHWMSTCSHHIIANSSFSWWGAWLNRNPGKVVIAPREWFKDPRLHSEDIIPEGWIKL